MDKKILGIIAVVIVLAAIIGGIAYADKNKKDTNDNTNTEQKAEKREIKTVSDADIQIYYGKGCPHCEKVEEFIITDNIDEKVSLNLKEVWYNKTNADEMNKAAETCGLPKEELGVPFMHIVSTGKCMTGDKDIIDYLKGKATNPSPTTTDTNANSNTSNTNS